MEGMGLQRMEEPFQYFGGTKEGMEAVELSWMILYFAPV